MAKIFIMLLGVLFLQYTIEAAPSEVHDVIDEPQQDQESPKLDNESYGVADLINDANSDKEKTTDGARQKRFFNHFGYPSYDPVYNYPTFTKRDDSLNTGYGYYDPWQQVYRQLQELASVTRQQAFAPPPPPQLPTFIPIFYIPQVCSCNPPANDEPEPPIKQPDIPNQNGEQPVTPGTDQVTLPPNTTNQDGSMPDLNNRFPETEDTRQIWGTLVNKTESDNQDINDDDYNIRPISFDIIPPPNRGVNPPAVEHGSVQNDAGSNVGPPLQDTVTTYRPDSNIFTDQTITPCDSAVISCCHRPEVTESCFESQGCPSPFRFGNACAPANVLNVVNKFKYNYDRNGFSKWI